MDGIGHAIGWIALFSVLAFAFGIGIGTEFAMDRAAEQCNAIGKAELSNKWYECKPDSAAR